VAKFVIDSNILFGAIISSREIYFEIIKKFDLYTPDFALKEIEKYEELILRKTKLAKKELNTFLVRLFRGITILPSIIIDKDSKQKAFELCKEIDEKDTPFIALAIELDIPFVTSDKKLYKELRKKGFSNIFLFEDFLEKFLH
jgi:predicted nucleic acid-binding protein